MNGIFAGFGEVMLRFSPAGEGGPPGRMEASFGGGEADVCVALAKLGRKSRCLTALPDHRISRAFAARLAGEGVDASRIRYADSGRMGACYLDRGPDIVYDRDGSTISMLEPEDYDFEAMLEGVGHLHLTGTAPALSRNACFSVLELADCAVRNGIPVAVDLNFRRELWNWERGTAKPTLARRCLTKLAAFADTVTGGEEDIRDVFGIPAEYGARNMAEALSARFPRAGRIALSSRKGPVLYDRSAGAFLAVPGDRGGDPACARLLSALA
jgi:2-dehydro-3-deoxygluconokinase